MRRLVAPLLAVSVLALPGSAWARPIPVFVCGNGIQEGPETCDDGNTVSGDGCSELCEIEGADGGPALDSGSSAADASGPPPPPPDAAQDPLPGDAAGFPPPPDGGGAPPPIDAGLPPPDTGAHPDAMPPPDTGFRRDATPIDRDTGVRDADLDAGEPLDGDQRTNPDIVTTEPTCGCTMATAPKHAGAEASSAFVLLILGTLVARRRGSRA